MPPPNDQTPKKPAQPQNVTPQKPAARPAATPQKPAGQAGPGKPATPPTGKPGATPAKAGATPPAKPVTPQPAKPAAKKPAAKKPAAAAKPRESGGKRKFGQVLIDLGFIDEDQLWEILEEAKSTGQMTGQVAVNRGLINEDQLLSTLAEQHNLRTVNLQEIKPTPEALTLVPETMANVYKVLPLSFTTRS